MVTILILPNPTIYVFSNGESMHEKNNNWTSQKFGAGETLVSSIPDSPSWQNKICMFIYLYVYISWETEVTKYKQTNFE